MWSTPAVWKQYNKIAVLHFFSSKFPFNIYSILFDLECPSLNKELLRITTTIPLESWIKKNGNTVVVAYINTIKTIFDLDF